MTSTEQFHQLAPSQLTTPDQLTEHPPDATATRGMQKNAEFRIYNRIRGTNMEQGDPTTAAFGIISKYRALL
jgi:hypothetical protein